MILLIYYFLIHLSYNNHKMSGSAFEPKQEQKPLSYLEETNCFSRRAFMWEHVKQVYRTNKVLHEKGHIDLDDMPVLPA